MATQLTVTPQLDRLDLNMPVVLDIQTDAVDFTLESQNEAIIVVNKEDKTITGVALGSSRVIVSATREGEDTATVTWMAEVVIIDTELTIPDEPKKDMKLGDTQEIPYTTNAQTLNVTSSDSNIAKVTVSDNKILISGVGLGSAVITVIAKKTDREEIVKTYDVNILERTFVIDDGISVGIRLVNTETNRTVNLTTMDNHLTSDVRLYLPSNSGTILTKEDLESNTSVIVPPRIISPMDGQGDYTGWIKASTYSTTLGFNGEHTKSTFQFSSDENFTTIANESVVITGDLTKCGINVPLGTWYVRVRYESDSYKSIWSPPIKFSSVVYNPEGSTLINPVAKADENDEVSDAYFGIIPKEELVYGRKYKGVIIRRRQYFWRERYYKDTRTDGVQGGPFDRLDPLSMYKGWQVQHKGKLYYTDVNKRMVNTNSSDINYMNDALDIPGWDKLENLPKYTMLIKYIPSVIQLNKKYVIEVYTDATDFELKSESLHMFKITPGIETMPAGGTADAPNGTPAPGAKFFTLTGMSSGVGKLKFIAWDGNKPLKHKSRTTIDYDVTDMHPDYTPTMFIRFITVNGTSQPAALPTPLTLEGVRYTVDKKSNQYDVKFTSTNVTPTMKKPYIFCTEHTNQEFSNYTKAGVYMDSSTSVMTGSTNGQRTLTYNNNGYFYHQVDTPAYSSTGYATFSVWMARAHGFDSIWKEDNRQHLVSPYDLAVSELRIGLDIKADHDLGLSIPGDKNHTITSSNKEDISYIKYFYKGGLRYMFSKPLCYNIPWTYMAFNRLDTKKRTIRIGKNLYYVRIPYSDELINMYTKLMNGSYGTYTLDDLGFKDGTKVWTIDVETGSTRKYVYYDKTSSSFKTGEQDPKSIDGAMVFVLEYIPEEKAPYNNLETYFPNAPKPANEKFIYDPISDTGYFGVISGSEFTTYSNVYNALPWTGGGSTCNSGYDKWFKFYYHGMIYYMGKRTMIHNVPWSSVKNSQMSFGFDIGGSGLRHMTLRDNKFRICVPSSAGWPNVSNALTFIGRGERGMDVNHIMAEHGYNSEISHLLHRVVNGYKGLTEVVDREWYYDNVNTGMNAVQDIQSWDNWEYFNQRRRDWQTEEVLDDHCSTNYDTDGDNTICHNSTNNNTSGYGCVGWMGGYGTTYTHTRLGVRALLILDPVIKE